MGATAVDGSALLLITIFVIRKTCKVNTAIRTITKIKLKNLFYFSIEMLLDYSNSERAYLN